MPLTARILSPGASFPHRAAGESGTTARTKMPFTLKDVSWKMRSKCRRHTDTEYRLCSQKQRKLFDPFNHRYPPPVTVHSTQIRQVSPRHLGIYVDASLCNAPIEYICSNGTTRYYRRQPNRKFLTCFTEHLAFYVICMLLFRLEHLPWLHHDPLSLL